MEPTGHLLARSRHFIVSHEYETVLLARPEGEVLVIGHFYGDPESAIIDWNEKWVVVAGCGIILYHLRDPYVPYEYDKTTDQWWEAHRSAPEVWSIEQVYQVNDVTVRFVVEPETAHAGVYDLNVDSRSIVRVIPG